MRGFLLFIGVLFLCSFAETSLKKRISDANFRYEFYTTDAQVTPKPGRQYYWFRGGAIHNSEQGIAGALLHSEYIKLYHSNQLAEAGVFKKGLKQGYWNTWFENGVLQSRTHWKKGIKHGDYFAYDKTGLLTEWGAYKNDAKHGRWINTISRDTLIYKNGRVVPAKVKDTAVQQNKRPGIFKRIFKKSVKSDSLTTKKGDTLHKPGLLRRLFKSKGKTGVQQDSVQPVNTGAPKKAGFFKRAFSKKANTQSNG